MKLLGIIGYPLGHSISPVFQQAAIDYLHLDIRYERWEIEPPRLPSFMAELRRPQYLGANVTVPHKQAVMPFLDQIDDWAKEAGAVNVIVSRDGKLSGHDTDGIGFIQSLKEEAGFNPRSKRVLVIGAGGAARAIVLALIKEGVASIQIANRTLEKARELARLANGTSTHTEVFSLDESVLTQATQDRDLIVQCTTMGMRHSLLEHETPLKSNAIPRAALVYDIVYNPPETPLLKEAKRAGARILGGLGMLVYQGVAAFELWTGKKAPVDVMYKAARRALGISQ